jgi:hypothetical protein
MGSLPNAQSLIAVLKIKLPVCGNDLTDQEPDSDEEKTEDGLKEWNREHAGTLGSEAWIGSLQPIEYRHPTG